MSEKLSIIEAQYYELKDKLETIFIECPELLKVENEENKSIEKRIDSLIHSVEIILEECINITDSILEEHNK